MVGVLLLAGVISLVGGIPWFLAERRYARVRRLLRFGRPEAGVVLSADREPNPRKELRWQVRYAPVEREGPARVAKNLDEDQVFALGGPGKVATVLVDPTDRGECDLYLALRRYYHVAKQA
jgi:hypothetical protein